MTVVFPQVVRFANRRAGKCNRRRDRSHSHLAAEHLEQNWTAEGGDQIGGDAKEEDREDAESHADDRKHPVRIEAATDRSVREAQAAARRDPRDSAQQGEGRNVVREPRAEKGQRGDCEACRRRETGGDAIEARREEEAADHGARQEQRR